MDVLVCQLFYMPILGSVEYSVLLTTVYIINYLPIIIIYTTNFVKQTT